MSRFAGWDQPGPLDQRAIRAYRLERVRRLAGEAGLAAVLITDPVNLRYATGTRNMQVWTLHNLCRYALVPAEGPVVIWELPSSAHLSRGLETLDEIRPSLAWDYMAVGPRGQEMARRLAAELADLVKAVGGGETRLGLDRGDLPLVEALAEVQVQAVDAKGVLERARAIKSPEEVRAFV